MINNKTEITSTTLEKMAEIFADMAVRLIETTDGSVEKAVRRVEKQRFPKKLKKSKKVFLKTLRMYKRWDEGLPVHRKGGALVRL